MKPGSVAGRPASQIAVEYLTQDLIVEGGKYGGVLRRVEDLALCRL